MAIKRSDPLLASRLRQLAQLEMVMASRGIKLAEETHTTAAHQAFQRQYAYAWADFVLDCIDFPKDEQPAPYQLDILSNITKYGREAVRGPRGLGKTTTAAWAVLAAVLTADDVKVITTAGIYGQLREYLWPEIHKWARRLKLYKIGLPGWNTNQLQKMGIRLSEWRTAFAVAARESEAGNIEGAHAKRILYVFDEAKLIHPAIWDATEGAFSNAGSGSEFEAYALAISTPGSNAGRFYDIHTHKTGYEDWHTKHVSLEETLAAGRLTREWVNKQARKWGKTSALYHHHVLGEFAPDDQSGIIPLAWIEAAIQRWHEWQRGIQEGTLSKGHLTSLGVDVGGGEVEGDRSVIAPCYDGVKIDTLRIQAQGEPRTATMRLAGQIVGILEKEQTGEAIIDVIGIGNGVVGRCVEQGYRARGFIAGWTTDLRESTGELGFFKARTAVWYLTREMLDPDSGFNVCLPPDDQVISDLTTPKWTNRSDGLIVLEEKKSIRKRLGRSTDYGDAIVMALAGAILCDEAEQRGYRYSYTYDPMTFT